MIRVPAGLVSSEASLLGLQRWPPHCVLTLSLFCMCALAHTHPPPHTHTGVHKHPQYLNFLFLQGHQSKLRPTLKNPILI